MNFLSRAKRLLILQLLCRHNGVNDIVDITGCSPNTVRAHIVQMGRACSIIHDRFVRGVTPKRLEMDELWSYVYAKRESSLWARDNDEQLGPRVRHPPAEWGERYTWIAHDPDSKLVISHHTGTRGFESALGFVVDASSRITSRPLISTDGYKVYADVIQRAFGSDMDHVVMEKQFAGWFSPDTGETVKRLVGLEKIPQNQSKADTALATTAHVERMNANIRNFNSRFTRQTYRFSKKLENHEHALAICITYYNFVRSHYGFRGTEWKGCTPAMKAGIMDRLWNYEDFLAEIDLALESQIIDVKPSAPVLPPQFVRLGPGEWSDKPFLVSYSAKKYAAKVHARHCRDCQRAAKGRKEGPRANAWYGFDNKSDALKCAQTLAPVNFSACSICILGHYPGSMVTGRGPDGRKTIN